MGEVLSIEEIERRYPDHWILIGDPKDDGKSLGVTAGVVLFASRDRDEMYRKAVELKPKHFASHCTQQSVADEVFVQ